MVSDNTPSIRGYRTLGEPAKLDKQISMTYLQQTAKAAKLLKVLRTSPGEKPCTGNFEKWAGEELPTDREAQLMCAGCPLIDICEQYAEEAHPAWGVWAGEVYGRRLQELMGEEA